MEDEVVFIEQGTRRERILRGTIVKEDADFIEIVRDDGRWSIRKSTVTKVVRRGAPR